MTRQRLSDKEKREKQLRQNKWYNYYAHYADEYMKEFKDEGVVVRILELIDYHMNNNYGYGSERVACSAEESLELVIKDKFSTIAVSRHL